MVKAKKPKWGKIRPDPETLRHIKESDECYHLMEYTKRGGWEASAANSLISNFKKGYFYPDGKERDSEQKYYREKAIRQFADDLYQAADDLYQFLKKAPQEKLVNISFIPTSKSKKDPKYDDRFELVRKKISEKFKNDSRFLFKNPIEILKSRKQSSMTSEIRDERYVQKSKNNFSWVWNHSKTPDFFLVFDDVITTGAQFRAYSDLIVENIPNSPIIGLFWTKAVEKDSPPNKEVPLDDPNL